MFKNEEEKWQQFRDLTEIMENTPSKQTADHFTEKVMGRLAEGENTAAMFSMKNLLSNYLDLGFQKPVTRSECAFYFLLTGFFYFILGIIMIIGLPLPAIMQNNRWISFQPVFGLLIAAELTILGISIYRRGDSAVRMIRFGTVLYAALIILNCWIGTFYIQLTSAVFFIAVFSMIGLVLAVLLGMAIDHYHQETIFSEVHR